MALLAHRQSDTRETSILDTGSTIHTTNTLEALLNTRTRMVTIEGIHGTKRHKVITGTSRGLDDVVHFQGCEVCLDSLNKLQQQGFKASITDDQSQIICVRLMPSAITIIFNKSPIDGLYRRQLGRSSVMNTNNRHDKVYVSSSVTIERAIINNRIEQMHQSLGHIPLDILYRIMNDELFEDCDAIGFTAKDVLMYKSQASQCSGCIEGKTTRPPTNGSIKTEEVKYTTDNYDSLRGDVMIVRGKHYLILLLHGTRWAYNFPLEGDTYTGVDMFQHIANVTRTFHSLTNKSIMYLRYDSCPRLMSIEKKLKVELGITLKQSIHGVKEPVSERYIRTLKEGMRATEASLNFSIHHGYFDNQLVDTVMHQLNRRPSAQYLYQSPYHRLFGIRPTFKSVSAGIFGQIVTFKPHTSIVNTMAPRVEYGLYLGVNKYNNYPLVMSLLTRKIMSVPKLYGNTCSTTSLIEYLSTFDEQKAGFNYRDSLMGTYADEEDEKDIEYIKYIRCEPSADRVYLTRLHGFADTDEEDITQPAETIDFGFMLQHRDGDSLRLSHVHDTDCKSQGREAQSLPDHNDAAFLVDGRVLRETDCKSREARWAVQEIVNIHVDGRGLPPVSTPRNINQPHDGGRSHLEEQSSAHVYVSEHVDTVVLSDETALACANMKKNIQSRKKLEATWGKPAWESYTSGDTEIPGFDTDSSLRRVLDEVKVYACSLQMNYKQSSTKSKDLTDEAATIEWTKLFKNNVFKAVTVYQTKYKWVSLKTIYTEKNGIIKARTVLLGNQLEGMFAGKEHEISSKTISPSTMNIILAEIAARKMYAAQFDVSAAFLNAKLPEDQYCYARVPYMEVEVVKSIALQNGIDLSKSIVNKKGDMYLLVVGALYGHPAAPQHWYHHINKTLQQIGYKPMVYDPCVFIKRVGAETSFIMLHVDDLFSGASMVAMIDELENHLRKTYKINGITMERNVDEFSYLNIHIRFNRDELGSKDGSVTLSQQDYYNRIIDKHADIIPEGKKLYPHIALSVNTDDTIGCSNPGLTQELFLSIVMSIYWGAKRTRFDILYTISYLSTRTKIANDKDWATLLHLLVYIRSTINNTMTLRLQGDRQVVTFVDSSMNLYADMKGHGGYIISFGTGGFCGPIEGVSKRHRSNCRSSMEYELMQLHDCLPSAIYMWRFTNELHEREKNPLPIILLEDNQSVMKLLTRGLVTSGNTTKHIDAKLYYAMDLVKEGIVSIKYCPTDMMIADIMTKPLIGTTFTRLKSILENNTSDTVINMTYKEVYEGTYIKSKEVMAIETKVQELIKNSIEKEYDLQSAIDNIHLSNMGDIPI